MGIAGDNRGIGVPQGSFIRPLQDSSSFGTVFGLVVLQFAFRKTGAGQGRAHVIIGHRGWPVPGQLPVTSTVLRTPYSVRMSCLSLHTNVENRGPRSQHGRCWW